MLKKFLDNCKSVVSRKDTITQSGYSTINSAKDNHVINQQEYAELLAKVLPHVIQTEEENERFTTILIGLDEVENQTAAEERIAELLTFLIEDFEEKNYAPQTCSRKPITGCVRCSEGVPVDIFEDGTRLHLFDEHDENCTFIKHCGPCNGWRCD